MNKLFSNFQNGPAAPVLTFLKDRLFFTCYHVPPQPRADTHFFTIDHVLVYQHFYADFGPLNLAQTVRFCNILQQLLQQPEFANKRLVMYSSPAADKKANALFLLCSFMMLVGKQTPEQACQPIASVADQIMPFRDAGYGPDTYHITILDCLKGLSKAMACKLLNLDEMDMEEYEYYEKVDHGDMNWLMANKFLAFATPHDDPVPRADPNAYPKTAQHPNNENIVPHGVPWRLNDYVNYFKKNKITTVVRLNHKVYDRQRFVEQGIEHVELYFHDGSCPTMEVLNTFLELVETDRRVAVHCKAGLGRTGSLIAAYLMKHYRFTASEIIGYLRIVRPGSVVGPQQNWLLSMQSTLWAMGAKADAAASARRRTSLPKTSNYVLQGDSVLNSHATATPAPSLAATLRTALASQQASVYETAVPATKTTLIGNHVVAIPVQPRKGADAAAWPAETVSGSAMFGPSGEPATVSAPVDSGSNASSRYNLRASTVAARSTPSSRSNSEVFDALTPRSSSNTSLKAKLNAVKSTAGQHTSRRKDMVVVGMGS